MQYLYKGPAVKKTWAVLVESTGYLDGIFPPLISQLKAFLCLISKNWTHGLTFGIVASTQYTTFQEYL